jgi:uncharacterized membrane protein
VSNGQQGKSYSANLAATGGTDPYTWSISSGALPLGLSLSSSGAITGIPTQSGAFSITAKVTDSSTTLQSAFANFSFTIVAALAPLEITSTAVPSGETLTSYSAALEAAGGTPPYIWSLKSGATPAGITLSSAGQLSGTPTQVGDYSFKIQVADSSTPSQTAFRTFTLIVVPSGSPLAVINVVPPDGHTGVSYALNMTAGGGVQPYVWSLFSGSLPLGLTLNSATGNISGTPTATGVSSFVVKVTDATTPTAQTATKSLNITVSAALPPLSITTTSLVSGRLQSPYSANLAASGGTVPFIWSISLGSLPPGLSLNGMTGTISGIPTVFGAFNFTVKVADSTTPTAQTATKAFSLTVANADSPLNIVTTALPNAPQASTYNAVVSATGGTPPYTWSISIGKLPAGLTLNSSTGAISGIPTDSGSSNFSLKVIDFTVPTAQTGTASFTILVVAGAGHSVLLNWDVSASSAAIGYNVYRSEVSGSGYGKVNSTPISTLTYTDGTTMSGQTYYYVLTSVDSSGDESGFSTELRIVIP